MSGGEGWAEAGVEVADGEEAAAVAKGPGGEAARGGGVVAAEGTPGTARLRTTAGDRERWRRPSFGARLLRVCRVSRGLGVDAVRRPRGTPAENCAVPGVKGVRRRGVRAERRMC